MSRARPSDSVLALAVLVVVRSYVLTPVSVSGISMEPTVHDGIAFVAQWTDPADFDAGSWSFSATLRVPGTQARDRAGG